MSTAAMVSAKWWKRPPVGMTKYERLAWHNQRRQFPQKLTPQDPPTPMDTLLRAPDPAYTTTLGATRTVLARRACYGGRKGNSALRKLGITPSTSARAARTVLTLRALQQSVQPDARWEAFFMLITRTQDNL